MNKPVLGLLLGAFDGLTALATPAVASQIVGIVIGSTVKGLIVGYATQKFGRGRAVAAR